MAGAGLRLEAREYAGPARWRWVLTTADGEFIKDHEVRLDTTDWQFEAFADLTGYLSWHVAPDRRRADEGQIVAEVGEWIGSQVLGFVATAMVSRRPVTVTVAVPGDARDLLFRPLELAHADGKPLAAQDVTLVMQPPGTAPAAPASVGGRLRVLGLFSLPDGGQPLNLRRERHSLVRLVQRIHAQGKAADVRVLHYGVTRDRLRDVLEEADGWDIIHISGHGAPGELLLETPAGKPDRISAADLADLLDLARESVKLVTVAACWSAATTADQQRLLLGLPVRDLNSDTERARQLAIPTDSAPLATELASRLNCAVFAMRYPVDDEFAIELTTRLYELLADKGQPLPRAVGMTLGRLSADPKFPALSVATPALFGGQAANLRLAAPERQGPDDYDPSRLKMSGFPPQPDRFVGRVGVMTRASEALASASDIPGVLLHGMPGGGKTACALELAYTHEHAFRDLVWYKAPDDGAGIEGALTDFALTLEAALPGLPVAHLVHDANQLTPFLPKLTELMERRRLLLVIDNAESLLTESGTWRDDNWGRVIGALTGHKGLGRLILTSRRVPAGLAGLRVEAVDALSADEALLLARELPNLRTLIYDELHGIDRDLSRRLAIGVLNVAQGHPKLLELADGQAGHPDQLAALVAAGDQAWREQGGLPDGFFTTGDASTGRASEASTGDYWHVLAAWTSAVADTLSPGERDLFWFLCCLEEPDRERWILYNNWANLWRRLGRDGEPPGLDEALPAVAATGLASIRPETGDTDESYAVHPGVAEAGRDRAGTPFRNTADEGAAGFWTVVHRQASEGAGDGSMNTRLLVRAGLATVPYLTRQHQWDWAANLLDDAFSQEPSRANAVVVLPAIEQIVRHESQWAGVLARVLTVTDPEMADTRLRRHMADAAARSDYRAAAVTAGELINLCLGKGWLAQALDLTRQKARYTRQAGLGPWNQLADEVQRLQVLTAMGPPDQVLKEIGRLRDYMATLPAAGPNEAVFSWNVRETLLDTGRHAAVLLGRWADALTLSADEVASKRDRAAPAADIARSRFNDYGPLLRLGRTGEAVRMLLECRQVFENAHSTEMLGKTFNALAQAEDNRGHGDAALDLQRDALRYLYIAGDATGIAVSYHNLGNYLRRHARQASAALASHLTAALIHASAGNGLVGGSGNAAVADLRDLGTAAILPTSVTDLDRQLGDIPGTNLPGLIAKLCPDTETAEQTLRDLIAQAQELAATPISDEQ